MAGSTFDLRPDSKSGALRPVEGHLLLRGMHVFVATGERHVWEHLLGVTVAATAGVEVDSPGSGETEETLYITGTTIVNQ